MSMIFNGTALDLIIDIANAQLCQSNSFLVDRGQVSRPDSSSELHSS